MSPQFYYILHLASLFVLAGYTFYAFAAPPETKKKVSIITGIASLLAFVAGFGLISKLGHKFSDPWIIVKLVCWFGLSGLAGLGYRKRGAAGVLAVIAIALIVIALTMVYVMRFKTTG
ncbi:MAG TPA: hypothetical protein VGE76_22880 [Opitutaceae bacterium]